MVKYFKIISLLVVIGGIVGLALTHERWVPLLSTPQNKAETVSAASESSASPPNEQVLLSKQAQQNLGLTSKPLRPTSYWKTINVPGMIVDRPGISDRGVVAPVTAIVTAIHHYAGDTVETGDVLFTLRLVGESFQTSQTELFKAIKDREIAQEHIDRLDVLAKAGGVAGVRIIDLKNEMRRLDVTINAYRQDLQIRGLTQAQINAVAGGELISDVVILVPAVTSTVDSPDTATPEPGVVERLPFFEVQDVGVQLGQQVQAGEMLCTLSHHQSLFIEGHAFRRELPLLQKAAEAALPITLELTEDAQADWDSPLPTTTIHHISNTLDAQNRTASFYLTLENQYRSYQRDGKHLFIWRFRPGQRVRLRINTEQLKNVFVLPADAVVQEGAESYVFRHNGDLFERRPVRVVQQTQDEVVIANDGSVPTGIYVAQSGAVQLNRALKSASGSAPAGVHVHADGSVHSNH
ncbi:HlyD family efflux transporter periplasmic adaptor subunit [Blastopirellula sp. J2-11]|uniref:efflux RND transporter periplasmic adaptor subunit n=1 Tax=Blastopirellula sp. J2-11 TaxID=2943192 RepID=UPI0021C748ED|nr:HlyD family efflux transporter periplasmic adaptor subunit [Blastopirellula sp. J2-11]UUO07176.1 HlyD family efflux transporter periplasmic adaptor subunit [Blastopirellula sp. J2-11]